MQTEIRRGLLRGTPGPLLVLLWLALPLGVERPLAAQAPGLGPADFAAINAQFQQAKRFEAAEQFEAAEAIYRGVLEEYPSAVPRVHHNLGLVRFFQRKYGAAIEALERGIDLDGTMVASRLFLGISYLNIERPEEALAHLEIAHRQQPTLESALHLGQAYAANLRFLESASVLRTALPSAGARAPDLLHAIGQVYLKLAESIINEQATAHPESKETHLAAARVLESQQVYQVAAIKYLEASELDPMNASIFFPLARMLAILGLDVPSDLALQRYRSLLPSVPPLPIDSSLLPREQVAEIGTKVDFEGILRSLPPVDPKRLPPVPILPDEINEELAARLRGAHAPAWRRAVEAAASGRFRETLDGLAAVGGGEDGWLRDYLAVSAHVWLDDYESAAVAAASPELAGHALQAVQTLRAEVFRQVAIEYFDRLVREHPGSCRARLVRAMNLAAQEKAGAEGEFLAAIELCPFDTEIRIELADYYLWNSQYREARQACLDELEIHPHSSAAMKRLGRIHVQLREAEESLPYLRTAVETDPADADVRSDLGRAYELLERWDDALAEYELALDLDPGLNRVHYVLARIYRQLGRMDMAREQFERFKRNEDEARQSRTVRIQRLRKMDAPASPAGR